MRAWTDARMEGWMAGWLAGWTDGCSNGGAGTAEQGSHVETEKLSTPLLESTKQILHTRN